MVLPTLKFKSVQLTATGTSASLCCFIRTPQFCVPSLRFCSALHLGPGNEITVKHYILLPPETKQGALQSGILERRPARGYGHCLRAVTVSTAVRPWSVCTEAGFLSYKDFLQIRMQNILTPNSQRWGGEENKIEKKYEAVYGATMRRFYDTSLWLQGGLGKRSSKTLTFLPRASAKSLGEHSSIWNT